MSLSIVKPGLLDTIQDLGRFGYAGLGINPGGAMDRYACQVANILVGNEPGEGVMEIHFPGAQILFEQNALICLTGADFSPTLNDELLPLWQPVVVRKNTVLHFTGLNQGARCYLGIHGGICMKKWLNSYSTNLKANAGGFEGRRLEKGDELSFKENSIYFPAYLKEGKDYQVLNWKAYTDKTYRFPNEIYFIKGEEWNQLTETSRNELTENNFIIHPFSDRMGYRLKGVELQRTDNTELVSAGVNFGTMQLLPNGQLIILMADHQTIGGYPRIGNVVSAHLPKLAQLRPSDTIKFKMVDIVTAEELLYARQQELNMLQLACSDRINKEVC